eukprot:g6382.t1
MASVMDRALRAAVATGWLPPADVLAPFLASPATCIDCREAQKPLHVNVAKRTPATLWSDISANGNGRPYGAKTSVDADDAGGGGGTNGTGRGGRDRERPWPELLKKLSFADASPYDQSPAGVSWPEGLKEAAFGARFNQALSGADGEGVRWPSTLKRITLRRSYGRDLREASWPSGLREPCLERTGEGITRVAWPASLERLSFGLAFDQPVEGLRLPPGMTHFSFGSSVFNHPVQGVAWPEGLPELFFGDGFNQDPVDGPFGWPGALEEIAFGRNFNQPVARVAWPPSLRQARFGARFKQCLRGRLASGGRDPRLKRLPHGVGPRTHGGVRGPVAGAWEA